MANFSRSHSPRKPNRWPDRSPRYLSDSELWILAVAFTYVTVGAWAALFTGGIGGTWAFLWWVAVGVSFWMWSRGENRRLEERSEMMDGHLPDTLERGTDPRDLDQTGIFRP